MSITKKIQKINETIGKIQQNIGNIAQISQTAEIKMTKRRDRQIENIYENRLNHYTTLRLERGYEKDKSAKELKTLLDEGMHFEYEQEEDFQKKSKEYLIKLETAQNDLYQKQKGVRIAEKMEEYVKIMNKKYDSETKKITDEKNRKDEKIICEIRKTMDQLYQKEKDLEKKIEKMKEDEPTIKKIESRVNDGFFDLVSLEKAISIGMDPSKIKNALNKKIISPHYCWDKVLNEKTTKGYLTKTGEEGEIKFRNGKYYFELDAGHQKICLEIKAPEEDSKHTSKRMRCIFPEGEKSITIFSPEHSLGYLVNDVKLRDKSPKGYAKFAESLKIVADYFAKEYDKK